MKKKASVFIILAVVVVFAACNKEKTVIYDQNAFCITRIYENWSKTTLSVGKQDTILGLFRKSAMDTARYKIIAYSKVDTAKVYHYKVTCNQLVNGLRVFKQAVVLNFKKDSSFLNETGVVAGAIALDTLPQTSEQAVTKQYFDAVNAYYFPLETKQKIVGACVELEFGYYMFTKDLKNLTYTKCWKIKPSKLSAPVAYINDATNEIIDFHVYAPTVAWLK